MQKKLSLQDLRDWVKELEEANIKPREYSRTIRLSEANYKIFMKALADAFKKSAAK